MSAAPQAVVIGAGHNGLVCAAYLASAGVRVHVVERRPTPGGVAATDTLASGVRVNRCFSDHVLIHATPILDDLRLDAHGLSDIEIDPPYYAPRLNDEGLVLWRDVARTADELGARSAADARAYPKFVARWLDLWRWLQPVLSAPPPADGLPGGWRGPSGLLGNAAAARLAREAERASVREVLDATFEDMHLKGVLAFLSAAAWGLSPTAPGSALLLLPALLPHLVGLHRPRGGSGALAKALGNAVVAQGGTVRLEATAQRILTEDGAVRGVRLADGTELEAGVVVASCHPQVTFLQLLDHRAVPPEIRGAIERLAIADGVLMKADFVLERLPEWQSQAGASARARTGATTVICPSLEYLEAAYGDYREGRNPRWPAMFVTTPTAADPSLAPHNRHLLSVETRYAPYSLRGVPWSTVRDREARRLYEFLYQYAPNLEGAGRQPEVETPEDLERELALPRAHPLHIDMTPAQRFHRRPLEGLAQYRTPVRGLYLTGAATHPGGGVWGAPGRNAAHEILKDLG